MPLPPNSRLAPDPGPSPGRRNEAERSRGLYALLRFGWIYHAVQVAVGARASWRAFVADDARIRAGESVLDVGCGVGDLLAYLPGTVRYWGYDRNRGYIEAARRRFGDRGTFLEHDAAAGPLTGLPAMDVVVAVGLLHHLSDDAASGVLGQAKSLLKPGGRFCSIDPGYAPSQSLWSRLLVSRDRGRWVRTEARYRELATEHFGEVDTVVVHDRLRIPYTHVILRGRI